MTMARNLNHLEGNSSNTKIRAITIVAVIVTLVAVAVVNMKQHLSNSNSNSGGGGGGGGIVYISSSTEEEIFGVKIEKNPPQSKLTDLAVTSWPKWSCAPRKFPWTFSAKETMYLLEGKVKVYCEGLDGSFEIGAGDLVEFPKGMTVTWDVIEAVNKHYHLDQ